ncbi:hypothetical protein [Rhizobium sp. BE258]|uniref:hypothetical protein n=1 Tax=Rhizobium sp. BE258 TaxID=2817722 RepID=UPI00285F1C8B|nr:hypothetical protein [Rhizobium sp. BE258]MDR7145171.1 hypothetical protein [Rhizobium sp. BE258]
MARIYLSFDKVDKIVADELAKSLAEYGHVVAYDNVWPRPTAQMASDFKGSLGQADVYIPLFSSNTPQGSPLISELGYVMGRYGKGDILILPILIGTSDAALAPDLRGLRFIRADRVDMAVQHALTGIEFFERERRQKTERLEEVKQDVSDFVTDAIAQQQTYESYHRNWAIFWYFAGVLFLLAVLGLTAFSIHTILTAGDKVAQQSYILPISLLILNIVMVGVFAALAKYAYSLGKSYMSESLKSSDRIHAIQFGKFFLKAYGEKLTPPEVKDAFQHWNIDRNSTFSTLDPAHIDPQIYSLITQLVSAIRSGKDGK